MIIKLKRKKKFRFVFESKPKPKLLATNYEKTTDFYGDDYQTVFGRRQFPDGSQWVIDAKTGQIVFLDKSVRYIGESKGRHFYLSATSELLIGDKAIASFE